MFAGRQMLPECAGRPGQNPPELERSAGTTLPCPRAVVRDPRARYGDLVGSTAARPWQCAQACRAGRCGNGPAGVGTGPAADRVSSPCAAGSRRRGSRPSHASLGRAHRQHGRGLADAGGAAGRSLDGPRFRWRRSHRAYRRGSAVADPARASTSQSATLVHRTQQTARTAPGLSDPLPAASAGDLACPDHCS